MSDGHATHFHDWRSIRSWAGSQDRAFEELCYQLRDRPESGWRTIKTAAPDGGVEWYDKAPDGRCYGHQVKYVHNIDNLLPQARKSAKAVGSNRRDRDVIRLTFWVPIDLPDPAHRTAKGELVQGARRRWDEAVASWKRDLPGVADIDIELVDSGQLLYRLLAPGNEGRQWFFFEQRALGAEWLRERLGIAESIAHDRYTPKHHVALPVATVIDGCAVTQRFMTQLSRSADALAAAMPGMPTLQHAEPVGLDETDSTTFAGLHAKTVTALGKVTEKARALTVAVQEAGPAMMPTTDMAAAAAEAVAGLYEALEAARQMQHLRNEAVHSPTVTAAQDSQAAARGGLHPRSAIDTEGIAKALRIAEQFEALCQSDAARAAEAKIWVLLGEAGQGKTHLLVEATKQALDEGRPSVTIFGEQMSGRDPLTQIAKHLGLGALSHTMLLQALDAAGAVSGARFTLIIDALNDSDDPSGWRTALPTLIAEASSYDYVAVVVSCRSSLQHAVLPDDLAGRGYPTTMHPGFAGHEVEALEEYLRAAPSALPRTPMLTPSFSNPLFVKLYCDSLLSVPEAARRAAATPPHRSAVFDAFLDRRAKQISALLHLDPEERLVHRAVEKLAQSMAGERREVLSRAQARSVIDSFAPQHAQWPNTLLGQLVAHGVLATERYYPSGGGLETGIGFAYQAFSDDRIVHAVLDQHRSDVDAARESGTLATESPLRSWLTAASANLIDAATVLLPEATGHDLIDLLGLETAHSAGTTGSQDGEAIERRRPTLFRSLVSTLGLRSTGSVTERTVQLLSQASTDHWGSTDVLEAVLTVTTQPGHRLNADRLHHNLLRHSPAERDAWWGIETYFMLEESGALHRLLRWAEQLPTPVAARPGPVPVPVWAPRRAGGARTKVEQHQPPAEDVVRLAATTLTWTLTSPNRFLRDRATKALVQLLLGFPDVLTGLLGRFLSDDATGVDDPYLFERLVLVAHGVLVRTRAQQTQPDLLRKVAGQVLDSVYGDVSAATHASRNVLLCDAATRILQSAHTAGLITNEVRARAEHPHPCPEPGNAPDESTLESRYPSRDTDNERLWGSLHSSLNSLADFANYEVRPAVEHFSRLPLATPCPAPAAPEPVPSPAALRAFREALPEAVREALGTQEGVLRLLDKDWQARKVLDDDQYRLLQMCKRAPTPEEQLATAAIDKEWASRWIMDRAAQRGWTPERFAQFDNRFGHGRGGREGHKAERFGKKYQWLALHELVERLASHRHMKVDRASQFTRYPGAGPLMLIDIDPTLPPAPHPLYSADEEIDAPVDESRYETFTPTPLDSRWNPPAPTLPPSDEINDWINGTDHLPDLAGLGTRTSGDGTQWVVLNEYASDHGPGLDWSGQPEQWHILHSWIVPDSYYQQTLDFLRTRTLMGRWMPEPPTRHLVHLGDLPLPEDNPKTDYDYTLRIVGYAATDDPQDAPEQGDQAAPASDPGLNGPDTATADSMALLGRLSRRYSAPLSEDRDRQLRDLAALWAEEPSPAPRSAEPADRFIAHATDGTALRAVPAVQEFSWSGTGHDCSLDATARLFLPCTPLLAGSDLRRDSDNGDWYTADGTLVVRALHGYRPTGEVTTLLVHRDWLEQRLDTIQMRLVLGLFGERQPRTTDDLRQWREYSQTAGLEPTQPLSAFSRTTRVRHIER